MERSKNNSFNENNKLDFGVGLNLAFICMIPPDSRIQVQVSIAVHMKYRELTTSMFSVHNGVLKIANGSIVMLLLGWVGVLMPSHDV